MHLEAGGGALDTAAVYRLYAVSENAILRNRTWRFLRGSNEQLSNVGFLVIVQIGIIDWFKFACDIFI